MKKYDDPQYHYAWIGFDQRGMTVVVARVLFSKKARSEFGNLFLDYHVFGGVPQN